MKETVFHAELTVALRANHYWLIKWPDLPVSAMRIRGDGQLRFALPKPCDLIGADPEGRLVAIECKLLRARSWRVDARTARQVATLRDVIRFQTFLTRAEDIEGFMQARREVFPRHFADGTYPPNTLVVVSRLVRPELLVEIEAMAVKPRPTAAPKPKAKAAPRRARAARRRR